MYSIFDQDRYGYYLSSDNKKFYSKLECMLYCKDRNLDFAWHFNDQYYDQVNWSQEPARDITDFYVERAQELRQKYDYLVLHLSGGHDSGNILETFMTNNIRLDEVITRGPYSGTNADPNDRSVKNSFAEIELCAVPIAKIAKEQYQPDLRITVIETKQSSVDLWRQNKNWFELGYNDLDPGQFWRGEPHLIEPRYKQMTDQGKTVAHIYGTDKPTFYLQKHQLYLLFWDDTINRFNPYRNSHNDISFIEHFYWSPSTGGLLTKQAHLILNKLNCLDQSMTIASKLMMEGSSRLMQDWVAGIIYPNRFLPRWDTEKSHQPVFREWHHWFWSNTNSDFFLAWKKHMDYLNQTIPKKWLGKTNIYNGGYKRSRSKGYLIGNIKHDNII
jgi:hypothetical protein